MTAMRKRLFVPLSTDPYRWFESGAKRWELRRAKGAFAPAALVPGRPVELRRGYSTPDSIAGTLGRIEVAATIRELLSKVPYREVTPLAGSLAEAVTVVEAILGPKPGPFVAFEVVVA